MITSGFAALVQAMSAVVREDGGALARAAGSAPAESLVRAANRHNCSGVLFYGLNAARLRGERADGILRALRPQAQAAVVQSFVVRRQVGSIVETLCARGIDHVLLKGAARLLLDDGPVRYTALADIDILVRAPGRDAMSAVLALGYRPEFEDPGELRFYAFEHHHLVPLLPPEQGKPVELHIALAPRAMFSLPLTFDALLPHIGPAAGGNGSRAFDAFGRSLHLALHGVGIHRLFDIVLLARELRADPQLYGNLHDLAEQERTQPIPLHAVLALAAGIAAIPHKRTPAVDAYLAWVQRREELLPNALRDRTELLDAWFGNGGRIAGPCTPLAIPHSPRRFAGQLLGSVLAAGVAALRAR